MNEATTHTHTQHSHHQFFRHFMSHIYSGETTCRLESRRTYQVAYQHFHVGSVSLKLEDSMHTPLGSRSPRGSKRLFQRGCCSLSTCLQAASRSGAATLAAQHLPRNSHGWWRILWINCSGIPCTVTQCGAQCITLYWSHRSTQRHFTRCFMNLQWWAL